MKMNENILFKNSFKNTLNVNKNLKHFYFTEKHI